MNTNREIAAAAFDAWSKGTGYVTGIFADNMTWEIVGRSAASKKYANRQQFIDEVLSPFGALFVAGTPFRPTNIRGIYADNDTVIVVWDGEGTTTNGEPYRNTYAWFMTFADGKVVDGTAFYDSIAFNELWEHVASTS